eukprot:4391614-Pyramimonas_sp.AAC.1
MSMCVSSILGGGFNPSPGEPDLLNSVDEGALGIFDPGVGERRGATFSGSPSSSTRRDAGFLR